MPVPTLSLSLLVLVLVILVLVILGFLGHEAIDKDVIQVVPEDVALHLTPRRNVITTYETSIFVISGPAHHLEQPQFQKQLGLVPKPLSESTDRRFVHTQSPADTRSGPMFFETPEDEAFLLSIQPGMFILGTSYGRAFGVSLVQSPLRHVYTICRRKGKSRYRNCTQILGR